MDSEMGEMPETESGPEEQAEGGKDTYYLPAGAVPEGVKVGDDLKFHVESINEDGEVEVSCVHGDKAEGANWRDEIMKVKDY